VIKLQDAAPRPETCRAMGSRDVQAPNGIFSLPRALSTRRIGEAVNPSALLGRRIL